MKKVLVFLPFHFFVIAILSSLLAVAQDKNADTIRKPFVTPIGKPFGNIASVKIDNRGGTIKSADGNLEVIVPENALDADTTFSIQSTHNDLNENDEGAYRLEPSGIQFKKPVQLIFHYKDGNENADIKGIAWQDDKGQWHRGKNIQTDTIQKTVSCFAPHFSRWAKFDKIYLSPRSSMLKVNKTLSLHLLSLEDINDRLGDEISSAASESATSNSDDDLLAAPHASHYYSGEYTVNGIASGNREVGVVTKQDNRNATYKAPATVPGNNPVAVSVQIYSDKKNKKLLLTSNITVVGNQYHFTYIHIDEGDGCYFMVDSSSCIVNMQGKTASITNIINYRPWSDWPNCDKCRWEWTNKETVKGLVEINGMAGSVITPPPAEGGVTNVNISLVPAMGNTPSAIAHCKSGNITIPSRPMPADPKYINFDIDGDDLVIHFGGKTGRNELVVEYHNEKTMIYMYKLN